MANLLASFTGNMRSADPEYFSHDGGFQQPDTINTVQADGLSYDEQVN